MLVSPISRVNTVYAAFNELRIYLNEQVLGQTNLVERLLVEDPPSSLNALAARLDDEALQTLLRQLDRACYTNGAWQGGALLHALKTLSSKKEPILASEPELSALYP